MKRTIATVALALLLLPGCFNVQERETIVMVEPGDVVEVVQEKKVKVRVAYKDKSGQSADAIQEKNIAGMVAMPRSVYRKIRATYIATYEYVNGEITEEEFKKRLQESRTGKGPEDDQKKNVPGEDNEGDGR